MESENAKTSEASPIFTNGKSNFIQKDQHAQQWRKTLEKQLLSEQEHGRQNESVIDENVQMHLMMLNTASLDIGSLSEPDHTPLHSQMNYVKLGNFVAESKLPVQIGNFQYGQQQVQIGNAKGVRGYLTNPHTAPIYKDNNESATNNRAYFLAEMNRFQAELKSHWNLVRDQSGLALTYCGAELDEAAFIKQAESYRELLKSTGLEFNQLIYKGKRLRTFLGGWQTNQDCQSGQPFDIEDNILIKKM